jgi:tetracycline resistance efflux pump
LVIGFTLNNTASPITVMIPIATTFVGYNISVINQGLTSANVNESAYKMLIHSIPFQFFSIVVVLLTFLSIYYKFNFIDKLMNNDTKENKRMNKNGKDES